MTNNLEALINPTIVEKIFRNCLFETDEIVDNKPILEYIKIEGVAIAVYFNAAKIENYREDINSMLENLMPEFDKGFSFQNICIDKNQLLWTGIHHNCDLLLTLGLAIGSLSYCTPREMWPILPGGLPYITRHIKKD